jgi:Activator of Hsp90 ATPase homolog 1-like protein
MIKTPKSFEDLTVTITQEIQVGAPLEVTFAALLEEIGPKNVTYDGKPLAMKIEPWPGGRWYRDLGENNGHLWAHVQAIKRPTLLEFVGPLFASFPCISNVQYRLSEQGGGTLISFRHTALGFIQDGQLEGMTKGWSSMNERVRKQAEIAGSKSAAGSGSR